MTTAHTAAATAKMPPVIGSLVVLITRAHSFPPTIAGQLYYSSVLKSTRLKEARWYLYKIYEIYYGRNNLTYRSSGYIIRFPTKTVLFRIVLCGGGIWLANSSPPRDSFCPPYLLLKIHTRYDILYDLQYSRWCVGAAEQYIIPLKQNRLYYRIS